jgi:cobalamin synthase
MNDERVSTRDQAAAYAGDLVAALRLLTVFPGGGPDAASEPFARATVFFPVVGLGLGALLWAVAEAIEGKLPVWGNTIVLLFLWELARAAKGHVAVGAALTREQSGRRGVLVVAGSTLLIKAVAIAACSRALPLALLFAPVLSFWSLVVLATGARDSVSPGRKFNAGITFREFALTSTFALAVVLLVAEALGLLVAVPVAALTLLLRLVNHGYGSGASWTSLQGYAQGVEIAVVALLALL